VNEAYDASRSLVLTHGDPDLVQAMVDGSPDGLCLLNPSRELLVANRAALDLLGLHLDPEGAQDPERVRTDADFDWSIVDRAAQDRQVVHRVDRLRDGRRVLATARATVSPEGAVSFVVLNLRDLTPVRSALTASGNAPVLEADCIAAGIGDSSEDQPTDLIARSAAMAAAQDKARQYAAVDAPVLLLGETGTGKRILARVIHEASARRGGPFMEVSCAALPEPMLDAELFGQAVSPRAGADRGAPQVGLIELAHGGTILIREIGDLSPALQIKLLRFMDDGEVWPVGTAEPRRPDVRLLACSRRDLGRLVSEGTFRADLYYRLNGLTLTLPPLHERREDVGPLIDLMLGHLARTRGRVQMMAPGAAEAIARCSLSGNVRELWKLVERLAVGTATEVINVHDLPAEIGQHAVGMTEGGKRLSMRKMLREIEAQMVQDALARYGTQTEAAKHLGVTQSTVARKAKQYGLGRR
jgi:transcriptional regulator with PAS, ATPase and Fis domain